MTISRPEVKSRKDKCLAILSQWVWPSATAATIFVLMESVSQSVFF
ncbi:MAG: hypothetical protein VW802_14715 [Rhodospirillaceae bacterium]